MRYQLIGLALFTTTVFAGQPCSVERFDDTAIIAYHYDGDTIKLNDGRRLRLVGINTPEIDHKGSRSQAFAKQARSALIKLLPKGSRAGLRYPAQRKDHYGRTLAHLFLMDGTNVQAELLRQGLATTLIVPPNQWQAECYQDIEQQARKTQTGVWSLPQYQPITASKLKSQKNGFHIITGKITRIGAGKHNIWLNMGKNFSIRIQKGDLKYFTTYDPVSLQGKNIRASGFLQKRKGQYRMQVRHPLAISLE